MPIVRQVRKSPLSPEGATIMPKKFRDLSFTLGHDEVYKAWRAGWSADEIKTRAQASGGAFHFAPVQASADKRLKGKWAS